MQGNLYRHTGATSARLFIHKEIAVMADKATDADTSATSGLDGQQDRADADQDGSQFYAGTYRDRAATEKGIQEKEAAVRAQQSRADKAEAELRRLNAEVITKLASAVTPGGRTEDAEQARAQQRERLENLKAEVREDPSRLVELTNAWMAELEGGVSKKTEALVKQLQDQIAELSGRLTQNTPEYQQHREVVELLRSKGLSIADAMEIAAKMPKPAQTEDADRSERSLPSGNTGGGAARGGGDGGEKLPAEALALLNGLVPGGLTVDEIKRMRR
jgi:hypothetical protein